ncbi:MAG: hypothetical protein Q4D98_04090 [Planctomycetia bacterium]|nr:hypothetical protein [Planctomycetia bacterium]
MVQHQLISRYPVFVVKIKGGYAGISTPESTSEKPQYAILVYSEEAKANAFIQYSELEGAEVFLLKDARELARVLLMQKDPFVAMAWDTKLEDGKLETTIVPIPEMLEKQLPEALSPWDYPVYFLQNKDGNYSVIQAPKKDGKKQFIIAMFTQEPIAEVYCEKLPEEEMFQLRAVNTPFDLKIFLTQMPKEIFAVGLNPMIDETKTHNCSNCITVDKLVERFLKYTYDPLGTPDIIYVK